MKGNQKVVYALWILLAEGVGALSGFLTRDGMRLYAELADKPPLSPPGILFPVVWTVLYALMGVGAARVYRRPSSRKRTRALGMFGVQLGFNFFWSIWFFGTQNYGFALVWLAALWLLVLGMIRAFGRVDSLAARLQIPYLLWVTFAAYLNWAVWMMN